MRRYSSYEIAEIQARRRAMDAREEARATERRERAKTEAMIVGAVVLTMAWIGAMVVVGRALLGAG